MQFQSYKIADLIPASYNPRKKLKPGDKEYEKIKNSIKEFGYVEPIIINSDMTIIGGHQRATVLADLGYTEVECIVVDIDKTKEKALNVALNKITGEWNKELLADLIKDLEDSAFDVGITGFEPPEIEQLFNSVHDKKITEDDFDVEAELAKPTVAKTGDVWLLGKHRVICGDSILPETYERLMDGRKANLVLTDPPYNVNVEETAGKIKNDNMPDEDFYKFLFAAFVNMEQSMEQDASIYVFHADTEGRAFDTLPEDVISVPGIEYAITSNGAAIYRIAGKECLKSYVLTPESVKTILKLTENDIVTYEAFIKGQAFASTEYTAHPEKYGATEHSLNYVKKTRILKDDIVSFILEHCHELDSIDIVVGDDELKKNIMDRIRKATDEVYMTSSISQLLEISYKDAGKKSGVKFLTEYLGLSRENVAAFGDADNDTDMIEYAGVGIAMENAAPHLKQIADHVTLHHDKDGVAYAFRNILNIC